MDATLQQILQLLIDMTKEKEYWKARVADLEQRQATPDTAEELGG